MDEEQIIFSGFGEKDIKGIGEDQETIFEDSIFMMSKEGKNMKLIVKGGSNPSCSKY
jgi:hypothetical protein